jgi:hypothetical protein
MPTLKLSMSKNNPDKAGELGSEDGEEDSNSWDGFED